MKRIEDERICFFLEHQELIEEWSSLSKQTPPVVAAFLTSLLSDLERLTERLDGNLHFYFRERSESPAALLFRNSWRGPGHSPRAAIGLEWPKTKVAFRGPHRPYVGIHIDRSQKGGAEIAGTIRQRLKPEIKSAHYTRGSSTDSWPAYRYMEPDYPEFWNDLDPFKTAIIEETVSAWVLFNQGIDDAINKMVKHAVASES